MTTTVAIAQLQSNVNADENLSRAMHVIGEAAQHGAKLIVFPELFMAVHVGSNFRADYVRGVSQTLDGPYATGLRQAARQYGIWVIAGMLETAQATQSKSYNTTLVINDQGDLQTAYHKSHLYDAFGLKESDVYAAGDELFTPIATPFGRMGLLVCYELRFPEITSYQAAHGVDFFVIPSAWVSGAMKEHHWRTLVTARAIENTAYMVTCDQVGNNYMGRSLVVDPMGTVRAEGSEEEDILYADIDLERLARVREKIPALTHRRPELYQR